jgi:hypothetical protein
MIVVLSLQGKQSTKKQPHMKVWVCYVCVDTNVDDMTPSVGPVGL